MSEQANGTTIHIRSACPHDCPDTCATIVEVENGRAVRFSADPNHPITQGWLCAKVRPYLDRVYHPDRLMHPLRRIGPKGGGEWERISWDDAIGEIATRWKAIIAEHGAAAILPYSYSGTLGLVEIGVASARLWARLGASGLERSICDAASTAAIKATVGERLAPDPRDVQHSKLVIIWGHNPASTNPHFMPLLREAQRAGTYVVVIDPRRTITARSADLFVQPRPATDAALALGLMHILFRDNLHDEPWLEAHSIGWRELRDRAAEYDPARVEAITGVHVATLEDLAHRYGATKPALLKFADGINRHQNGGQQVRALCCLPAIVGQLGVRGGGLFYSQSGHIGWDWQSVSHAADCPPTPRIVNMNRLGAALTGEVTDPPIQSLYCFAANPVTSTPNASRIIEGMLRKDLFTVVHEQFMTDTARYADIVLPATTVLEQTDLFKPYGHRHLQYSQQAIPAMGECKSNWETQKLIAAAMGFDEPWMRQTTDEVIREVLDATRAKNPRLDGITLERLQAEGTIPYSFGPGEDVPFADGRFPTPSGKVELRSSKMESLGLDPLPTHVEPAEFASRRAWRRDKSTNGLPDSLSSGHEPFILITGAAHHFVSGSFANQPKLFHKEGAPFVELHPEDAAARGIVDGDQVLLENARGSCRLRAVITDDVMPGVAVAPKGYWGSLSPDGRNVNWLTSDALADLAGQATFHSNLVDIRRVEMTDLPSEIVQPLASVAD